MKGVIFCILLLALLVVGTSVSVPHIPVRLNMRHEIYHSAYLQLHYTYANNANPFEILGRDFLANQRPGEYSPPQRWVDLLLCDAEDVDCNGEDVDRATLSFADDNLYLLAFKNKTGRYHAMDKFDRLFPDAIALPFGDSYGDLLGKEGHKLLANVHIGKSSAVWAMTTLSRYPSESSVDDVKQALARCAVMFSEALRLTDVRNAFDSTWGDEQEDVFLDSKIVDQVVAWGDICTLLIRWEASGRQVWGGLNQRGNPLAVQERVKAVGVTGPYEALERIGLGVKTLNGMKAWRRIIGN